MIQLEPVACGLCGSTRSEEFLRRGDLSLFLEGEFKLVRCQDCGLVYMNPRPTISSLNEIYPEEYDQYTVLLRDEKSALMKWSRSYGLRKRIKPITNRVQSGHLLDVGCATGDFLEVMKTVGIWELHGVEINASAGAYAREKLGLPIVTGSVEDAGYPAESFDVITMWNVIEHLPDPVSTLKHLAYLLKPDGILVFNTPNLDSLDAKIYGKYWIGYELPRHFFVFSMKTINELMEKAGFKLVESRCRYGSHALAMSSLRFWLRANSPAWVERIISSIIMSLPVRILASPYFFIADRLNWSTAPTMVCVKQCKQR